MMRTPPSLLRRTTAMVGGVAVLLAGVSTTAPSAASAATAGPVFSELSLDHDVNTWTTSTCTRGQETVVNPATMTLGDNGSVRSGASRQQTFTAIAAVPDTMAVSVAQSATASASTRSGRPAGLRLDFGGTGRAGAALPQAACSGVGSAQSTMSFSFAIARPMWATLGYVKRGDTFTEIFLTGTGRGSRPYEDLYGQLLKGSGSTTVLLPAGEYEGYLQGSTELTETFASKAVTGGGTLTIGFAEPGSALAAPSGTATRSVSLGSARSCAVHGLSGRLSRSAKRIAAIKKVSFAVNGTTVKSLSGRKLKRGLAVRLPIADEAGAMVRATVKLKNGVTRTVSASYRACA